MPQGFRSHHVGYREGYTSTVRVRPMAPSSSCACRTTLCKPDSRAPFGAPLRSAYQRSMLNRRQRSGAGSPWKGIFDSGHFGTIELQRVRLRVVGHVFRGRCLGDHEHGRIT